jgi:hypothetical protein
MKQLILEHIDKMTNIALKAAAHPLQWEWPAIANRPQAKRKRE